MPSSRALTRQEINRALAMRSDNWQNLATGLGTMRDKGQANGFTRNFPKQYQYYSDLYHGDPFARRVAEIQPREMLRQGFRLDLAANAELQNAMAAEWRRLDGSTALFQAMSFGRALGSACVYMGVTDGLDPVEPLDLDRVVSLDFLKVIPANYLVPVAWYSETDGPDGGRFGQHEIYQATLISPSGQPGPQVKFIHESRMIRFDGLIGTDEQRARSRGFGDSIYLIMEEKLGQLAGSFNAVATMLGDGSQAVFKIKGLIDQIADADGDEDIRRRMMLMDFCRSVAKMVALDADGEEFEYQDRTFSGVPESVDRMMFLASFVTGIPVTVLFGRSPAGMNATGESDIRMWYDLLKSEQHSQLEPKHRRLLEVAMSAKKGPAGGRVPDTWTISYNPLWQMSDQEQANVRKTHAEADALDLEWGVLTAQEITRSRYGGDSYSANIVLDREARGLDEDQDGQQEEKPSGTDTANPASGDAVATAKHSLTGIQVTSLLAVIQSAAKSEIPRDSAQQLLQVAFALTEDVADKLLGTIGQGFEPPAPPPVVAPLAPGQKPPPQGAKPAATKPGDKPPPSAK